MQTIRISLMADSTTAQVLDGDLKPTALKPSVTMFTDTQVKLTLYHADMQRYTASELNFGFDFYVDDDFKTATEPKFGTTSGITVDADGVITIPLDLSTQAGAGWIDGSESRPAIAELQGHALSNDDADFVLQFPVRVKNRVFIGGTYTPSPIEGLFYTKAQSDGRFNTKLPIVATSTEEKFLKENGTFSTVTSNVHVSGNTISEAGGDTFVGATFSHTHTFASITSKPTTLAGYGITDAASSTHAHSGTDVKGWLGATVSGSTRVFTEAGTWANSGGGGGGTTVHVTGNTVSEVGGDTFVGSTFSHAHAFSAVTDKPTTLSGYGITDALPTAGGTMTGVITFASTQTFPMATSASAGAVKAESAESGDTQAVRIGADGKLYTAPGGGGGGVAYYTFVVDTQEKFDLFARRAAGHDYTSVAIIGGPYYMLTEQIDLTGTDRLDGFCGAKVVGGDVNAFKNGKNISNIEVELGNGVCFTNCTDIRNCTATSTINCFDECNNLMLCSATADSSCFNNCKYLTNCSGNSTSGYAFNNCKSMSHCRNTIGETSALGTFNECYASSTAIAEYACADTPAGGFNVP